MVVMCASTELTMSVSPQTSVLREGTRQEQGKVNCVACEVLTLLDVHLNVFLVPYSGGESIYGSPFKVSLHQGLWSVDH